MDRNDDDEYAEPDGVDPEWNPFSTPRSLDDGPGWMMAVRMPAACPHAEEADRRHHHRHVDRRGREHRPGCHGIEHERPPSPARFRVRDRGRGDGPGA